MEISDETPVKKQKKLTSVVWNHFERIKNDEVCYAVCVHCEKKLCGSSKSGTTHLRNHLMRCPNRSNYDISQILAAKRVRKESTISHSNVNHDEGQRKNEDYVMEISNEIPLNKPRRLTSIVWNHFERVKKADICYAVCVYCKKKLCGSSNSGTTHLRNHLIRCLKRSNYDVSQILSAKRNRKENSLSLANVNHNEGQRKDEMIIPTTYKFDQEQNKDETNQIINLGSVKFDQERSLLDLARMIMVQGYPLAMVEHVGFRIFMKNLQPLFEVMPCSVTELDCVRIYGKEKQKVFEMIRNVHARINLAVAMWVSPENSEFMCLTANYIDGDWKLQKKILNFVTLDPSHTDDGLSDVVIKCLTDWQIDHRLFSATFDDCFTYDDMVFKIKDWLYQNNNCVLKNGELFDVRCAAHLLKSTVQDAVEAIRDVINKVRESVRYVKSSLSTKGKFNEIALQVGIKSEKHLLLDCPMRWDSTYLMLETALEYRDAFSHFQEHDPDYPTVLSDVEWEWASSVTGYMKTFVEIINVFKCNRYPTANIYFPEICDVHVQLIEWCKSPDDFLCSLAVKLKTKFEKYWNKCNLTLAIAAILDPRFKMKLVEYYYPQIYGSDAPDHMKEVSDGIRELFNVYTLDSTSIDQNSTRPGSCVPSSSNVTRDRLTGFDKFLHESSQSQNVISDLDKYLEEAVFPRNYDFNILNWWKVHTPRYPILSIMACDVLAIPVSTLEPELAFSTQGRVLDHHQSSINPDTRQALICGQDWLRMESEEIDTSSRHPALSHLVVAN